jgi:hypothetical protein
VRLDLSEIFSFLLLFHSYEFDLETLYIYGVGSIEHLWIFSYFVINFASLFARWLHRNSACTGNSPFFYTSDSNIHFPFSMTFSTLTSRLSLVHLRCMVHHSQVLVSPSSTTIMTHTSLHVFHKHTLETLLHVEYECWHLSCSLGLDASIMNVMTKNV